MTLCSMFSLQKYTSQFPIPSLTDNSITSIFSGTFSTISQKGVGALADAWPMRAVWLVVALLGFLNVCGYLVLCRRDKKAFPLLYGESTPRPPQG